MAVSTSCLCILFSPSISVPSHPPPSPLSFPLPSFSKKATTARAAGRGLQAAGGGSASLRTSVRAGAARCRAVVACGDPGRGAGPGGEAIARAAGGRPCAPRAPRQRGGPGRGCAAAAGARRELRHPGRGAPAAAEPPGPCRCGPAPRSLRDPALPCPGAAQTGGGPCARAERELGDPASVPPPCLAGRCFWRGWRGQRHRGGTEPAGPLRPERGNSDPAGESARPAWGSEPGRRELRLFPSNARSHRPAGRLRCLRACRKV